MWVHIKNAFYNLNHVIMISASGGLDEAGVPEISQKPCIQLYSSPDTIATIEFETNGEMKDVLKSILRTIGLSVPKIDFSHPFGYTGFDVFKNLEPSSESFPGDDWAKVQI
tara:strand:+ start:419 stop:751 length:333 start_codon:yes stop_codon:yes gene_type:complete